MAIELIGKIKPKNNGTFAMADAVDIEMPDGSRLPSFLEAKDAAVNKQISTLEAQDGVLGQKVAALEAKDGTLEQQIGSLNAQGETMASDIADLQKQLSDMNYGEGLKIKSIGHNAGVRERGSKITELTVSWSYENEKTLRTQSLDGANLDKSLRSQNVKNLNITMDSNTWKYWKLTATDEREKVVSGSTGGFTFHNGIYYGAAAMPEAINSAFVRSLMKNPVLTGSKVTSFTVNAGDGEYAWYCLPTRLKHCTFEFGANEVVFEEFLLKDFENGSGYKEDYYVYHNANPGLGSMTLGVK